MLELVCGDPNVEKDGGSYSRFVLPFAYKLEQDVSPGVAQFCFEPQPPDDQLSREAYLTQETADVLFERARWMRLQGDVEHWDVTVKVRDGQALIVRIAKPWLVLFECPDRLGDNPASPEENLLRTGFLLVELYFPEAQGARPNLDDLLEINELFRYWQSPFPNHAGEKGYKRLLADMPLKLAADPKSPLIKDCSTAEIYFERWASFLELPIKMGNETWRLFPHQWAENARAWVMRHQQLSKAEEDTNTQSRGWAVYADERAFVWTCALLKNGGNELRQAFNHAADAPPSDFGHWIKLLNVDQSAKAHPEETSPPSEEDLVRRTHNSLRFEQDWAKQRTYLRWAELGTFYGFAYHSGAMLAAPMDEPPLWRHFGQMYFDQVLLLLYLRVTLFRFSTKLNKISSAAMERSDHTSDNREWLEQFQQLRLAFMHFTNLYQFPLISNQQQGIEMYTLAREVMDVDEFYLEIKEEIHNANDYLTARENHQLTDTTTKLTKVATFVLPIVLGSSLLGMNVFSGEGCWSTIALWLLFILIVGVGYLRLVPFMTGKKLSETCSLPRWLSSLENFVERQLGYLKNFFCGHTTKGTD
jgi:hypothetical protein